MPDFTHKAGSGRTRMYYGALDERDTTFSMLLTVPTVHDEIRMCRL